VMRLGVVRRQYRHDKKVRRDRASAKTLSMRQDLAQDRGADC
jgi:hypothetical protein